MPETPHFQKDVLQGAVRKLRVDIEGPFRVGYGYDVHRLAEGRKLILGGVEIPFDRGLDGHSDADVLIHSVMDAILGALGKGDIGVAFPDTDERYRNIESRILLRRVRHRMFGAGFLLLNLDVTIAAERPKLKQHIPFMRRNLASDLNAPVSAVSIKATTEEGLGFTGTGQGMAAAAIVLLRQREPSE